MLAAKIKLNVAYNESTLVYMDKIEENSYLYNFIRYRFL